jgi:hypothetical protein
MVGVSKENTVKVIPVTRPVKVQAHENNTGKVGGEDSGVSPKHLSCCF